MTTQNNGPVHVLMALASTAENNNGEGQQQQQQRQWELNPRLQRDYIARRTKAYYPAEKTPYRVWSGVNSTEYSLVCCCENQQDADQQEEYVSALRRAALVNTTTSTMGRKWTKEYPLVGGGVLDVGQEVRFLGIMAKDCHTMSTRVLAFAILERTLDTHLWELEEAKLRVRPKNHPLEEGGESGQKEANEEVKEEHEEGEEEEEDEDEEDSRPGQKRRSSRLRKQQPKYKRTKRKAEKEGESSPTKQENSKFDYEQWSRLEQFFTAGGLRLLNRWLVEASDDEPVLAPPSSIPPPSNNLNSKRARSPRSNNAPTTKPSSTRPLILPILRFLERIPFDKKLVVDSKINKQIRNIQKLVDGILQARAQGEHNASDLQNWTTESTSSETDALEHIKEAIENVKKAWSEKTKHERETFGNPFETLTDILRERLGEVAAFEGGSLPRPDWMELPEEKKESKAKKSRSELAAKERLAELEIQKHLDEDLKKKLREAEKKHRERLAQIRELRKIQEANAPSLNSVAKKKSGGKEVKWKDGMMSKSVRNRKELEEVFEFDKNTPANKDIVDFVEDEDRDATPETITTIITTDNSNVEDLGNGDVDTDDMIDFSLV